MNMARLIMSQEGQLLRANMIQPHSGKLLDRVIKQQEKESIRERAKRFFSLVLDEEKAKEVQNIAHGVFSPLQGFLNEVDFLSGLKRGILENGLPWSIPIILDIFSSDEIEKGDGWACKSQALSE